ncbi:hypothetical protein [Ralstonia pseudosolanacearum]|uniref:hypothetical protein n=1 Tax=Ralstonia pseudosolanacearum TaxID=1310165 RepID=UPI000DAD2B5D|nr:hypothetical protein [Ralstonia pseudosolanacearum]RAA14837.1 hypothetical protein DOT79_16320 [Ralstonia pseudosolanacearum]
MKVTVEIDDKDLWIDEETWGDVKLGKGTAALANVGSTAAGVIKRGGAFIVFHEERGVIRRFDRLSDFKDDLHEINEKRKQLGLDPVNPDSVLS